MDDFVLARIVHVVVVLFWIGSVGFVTWVVMPTIGHSEPPADRLGKFHAIEGRFAGQAKIWVLLAGASGFWMVHRAEMWSRCFYTVASLHRGPRKPISRNWNAPTTS